MDYLGSLSVITQAENILRQSHRDVHEEGKKDADKGEYKRFQME